MGDPREKTKDVSSAIVPVARPVEPEVEIEPLDAAALHTAIDVRIEEMFRRKEAGDHLATIAVAESILLEVPSHRLAATCHAEATHALGDFFQGAPSPPAIFAALDVHARLLLARTDGRATIGSLLPTGAARATTIRALHDLVRLGLISWHEPDR